MHILWRRGSPYVYKSVRTRGKVISEYQMPYWEYYARTGKSWRTFLSKRSSVAPVVTHPEQGKTLDLIDTRVKAAKKRTGKNAGIILLPSGTRKKLPR